MTYAEHIQDYALFIAESDDPVSNAPGRRSWHASHWEVYPFWTAFRN